MSPLRNNYHNAGRNAPVPKSSNICHGNYFFCGLDHHRTDPSYIWPSVDLVSTDPPTYHMMHFQTEVDMLKFSVDCSEIRRVIADINCEFESGRMSEVIKFHNYRIIWLPLIESFIGKWGLSRVTAVSNT